MTKTWAPCFANFSMPKALGQTLQPTAKKGFETYSQNQYDLCILDVMMPVMDGYTLARKIRSIDEEIPIIFLTAKSMKEDTIEGFQSGGDDYLTKPFSMEELLYRIRAILKRSSRSEDDSNAQTYQIGNFIFDPNSQLLEQNGRSTKLTSKESELLKVLAQNRNKTVQRELALKLIWGDDTYFNARSMDVYISKLRKHFVNEDDVEIVNVHGKGFKLVSRN